MKIIEANDIVLFTTREQLQEYLELSGAGNLSKPYEIDATFPQIQSKFWSVELSKSAGELDTLMDKRSFLGRLVSYEHYKLTHGELK